MSEPLTDAEAIDGLERKMAEAMRKHRWVIVMQAAGLVSLCLLDIVFVVTGLPDRWAPRDLVMVGGLTILGLMVCLTRADDWRHTQKDGAHIVKLFRDCLQLTTTVREMREAHRSVEPLIQAMHESARTGLPITVVAEALPPADDDAGTTRH